MYSSSLTLSEFQLHKMFLVQLRDVHMGFYNIFNFDLTRKGPEERTMKKKKKFVHMLNHVDEEDL